MYMCIVHARIPLIPRLLEEVNFTKKRSRTYNQCINLLASMMQWSLSILISSVLVCLSVGQQEFHHLKVAVPEVT